MSAYDKMNEKIDGYYTLPELEVSPHDKPGYLKNAPADFVEPVMAEVKPEVEVKANPIVEGGQSAKEVNESAPVAPTAKPKHSHWLQSPGYVKAEEALAEAGRKRMEKEEREAKRRRDMAVLGDIANLAMHTVAVRNGITKYNAPQSRVAVEDERLRALKDKHAAQLELYARRVSEAGQKEREYLTKRQQEALKMYREDEKRAYERAKDAATAEHQQKILDETERWPNEQLKLQRERKEQLRGRSKDTYTVDGVEYDDLYDAYIALPDKYKKKTKNSRGKYTEEIDYNVGKNEMIFLVKEYNRKKKEGKPNGRKGSIARKETKETNSVDITD